MTGDDKMNEDAYMKVGRLFARVGRLHKSECEKNISKLQIHRGQHFVLMMLEKENNAESQKKIAEKLKISTAAVAVMLKKLQSDGLIKKSEDESDYRVKRIEITEKGKETLNKSREYFAKIDKDMLRGLSDRDTDELYRILCIMERNLLCRRKEQGKWGLKI